MRNPNAQQGIKAVWDGVGEGLPAEQRLPSDGLSTSVRELGGHDVIVITMPPALEPGEAHFAAFVVPRGQDPVRYVTLELSRSPLSGDIITFGGGWDAGSHLNYGIGPNPDLDAFLRWLDGLLARWAAAR
jgi:hypothetical protein